MTNHPQRSATAANRRIAEAAGLYIALCSYRDRTHHQDGRWYFGHDGKPFEPCGPGYATNDEAWKAAAEFATQNG